jgi:hypothetical protein
MEDADPPQLDEEDYPPLRESPHLRRDTEPHRGPLLHVLGVTAVILAVAGVPCGIPLLLALPLGVTVYLLADHDLGRMRAGGVDRRGEGITEDARDTSFTAVAVGAGALLLWALAILFCWAIWPALP